MKTKFKYLLVIITASLISILTHIAPIFFNVPKYLYLNIGGTVLVSSFLGVLSGMFYSALVHIVLNNVGMGIGTQYPVLIIQCVEALLIGFLLKRLKGKKKLLIIPIIILLLIYPVKVFIYFIFNNSSVIVKDYFLKGYFNYIFKNFFDNFLKYFISLIIGYWVPNVIIKGVKKYEKKK